MFVYLPLFRHPDLLCAARMNAGYRILPEVYDRWQKTYGKDFSELILPRLLSTLRKHQITGPTMVDIACGTGTLALMMARRGWNVTAVDASEGMVARAKQKARVANLPLVLHHQDMRSLRLPQPVHLATSFFDSVNHLLVPDDLLTAFRCVHDALLPGGWFVFDVNNELCYRTLWTKSDTIQHEDFVMTLDSTYDREDRRAVCRVTLAMTGGGDHVHRTETVRERYYPAVDVRRMLKEAGFAIRGCEDFNFTSHPRLGKVKTWWIAEKV